ncbi:helix-turn-helix transcriptional regulator [Paenibacillus vandeheii]|nr:AraC family transcriptional regulator [Paenibacillus vandeheii]
MVEWIHMHFADSIKLEDIARAGQLSRSETCRYFKQMLKTTPMQYVIDYRIRKSVEMLQIPDYSITQIAYEVGFNSTSYFINQGLDIEQKNEGFVIHPVSYYGYCFRADTLFQFVSPRY